MTGLPIEPLLPAIRKALATAGTLVLQAPPGAGKTTRVPLALLDEPWVAGGRILVVEPRRLAARMAAGYMARLLGEEVAGTIGYRVRLDTRVGPSTRIELVTDGLFLRRIQSDPALDGVAAVIFDEVHERGLDSDLSLALAIEARAALRPDLRLLAMSATLDAGPFARLLGDAPVLTSEGRAFPVELRHIARTPDRRIEAVMADAIADVLETERGSVLAFLPGGGEIRRVATALEGRLPRDVEVAPLYGDLDRLAQDRAVAPSPPGRRKIVLATSIAETSLTIEGVRVVIDSGLSRVPRFDPRTGLTRLETVRTDRATAEQRRGRAGRLEPGLCIRLWTAPDHRARAAHPTPEILEADLAPLALELALWGSRDATGLAFLDPPPAGSLAAARATLQSLGALDREGRVTDHGRAMAGFGTHPRLAHMMIAGRDAGFGRLAAEVAAVLSERDLLRGPAADRGADLSVRIGLLRGGKANATVDRAALVRAKEAARRWATELGTGPASDRDLDRLGEAVALAYPDRVAEARPGGLGQFRLSNGRGAVLDPGDPLASQPYLAVAELGGEAKDARIFLAAQISLGAIEALFSETIETEDVVAWETRAEAVIAVRRVSLGALVLEEKPLPRPDPDQVADAMAEGIRTLGLQALPWNEAADRLRARIAFLALIEPGQWPDVGDEALRANLRGVLGHRLEGVARRAQLDRVDLAGALLDLLDHRQRRALDRLAPETIAVPSGRQARIDYASGEPVLAVKLQEMFGALRTPTVAGGRVPVTVHLLSPAGRPLQVTRDLEGFWRTGYAAVRAEMRGRYPRHPWPEDPTTAPATARAKQR